MTISDTIMALFIETHYATLTKSQVDPGQPFCSEQRGKEGREQARKKSDYYLNAPWSPRVNFENDDFKCKKKYFFYLHKIFYLFTAIAECKKQRQLIILRGFTGLLPIS